MTIFKRTQRAKSLSKYAKKAYRLRNWREYEAGLRDRGSLTVWLSLTDGKLVNWDAPRPRRRKPGLSFIIIDPAGMVPLVALRRTKKPGSARAGTCRDHAINGPRSWTTQSRGTPAIDAQRLNWLRRRRAIRSGGGAHPLAATRRLLRSVMVGA